jgi:hypothetical protein
MGIAEPSKGLLAQSAVALLQLVVPQFQVRERDVPLGVWSDFQRRVPVTQRLPKERFVADDLEQVLAFDKERFRLPVSR